MIRGFCAGPNLGIDLAVGQKIGAFRRQQEMVDPDAVVPVVGAALERAVRVLEQALDPRRLGEGLDAFLALLCGFGFDLVLVAYCLNDTQQSSDELDDHTTWDVSYAYDAQSYGKLKIGSRNVTNEEPVFDKLGTYAEGHENLYDNTGRTIYAEYSLSF